MWGIVLCLIAGAYAAPISSSERPFHKMHLIASVEHFNKMCGIFQSAKAKEYMPSWMVDPVCALSDDDKQLAVDFTNKFHDGEFDIPSNTAELLTLLKKEAPAFGETAEKIYAEAVARWKKLTPAAQEFMRKWESVIYEVASHDQFTMFQNMLERTKELIADEQKLGEEDRASMKEQCPEIYHFYHDQPKFKAVRLLISNLPSDYDFKQNPETMRQIFNMSIAKYMPEEQKQ